MIIGNINGRQGTYPNGIDEHVLKYTITSVDGGMEKHQRVDVSIDDGEHIWRTTYETDSRCVLDRQIWRDGAPAGEWEYEPFTPEGKLAQEYKSPEWVPAWMETVEPGPDGLSDICWLMIGDAITSLAKEKGIEPLEDITDYSIDNGVASQYSEGDEE